MISAPKGLRRTAQWHRWFAWRPVTVWAGSSPIHVWVWWQWIERKVVAHHGYDGTDYTTTYRLIP